MSGRDPSLGDDVTRPIGADDSEGPTQPMDDRSASRHQGGSGGPRRPSGGFEDDRTQIVGGQKTPDLPEDWDPMRDPVVGWLVVVSGVGKGSAIPIGYGQNTVGRGEDARAKLLFGGGVVLEGANIRIHHHDKMRYDEKVSRIHFVITYDGRGRTFYIQGSPDSKNLTYLKNLGDEEPLLQPRELEPYARIVAGETELVFVPLCHRNDDGTGFDWQG